MDRQTSHRAGPRAHRPDRWLAPQHGSLGESGQRQDQGQNQGQNQRKPSADQPTEQFSGGGAEPEQARPQRANPPRPSPRPRPADQGDQGGRDPRGGRPTPPDPSRDNRDYRDGRPAPGRGAGPVPPPPGMGRPGPNARPGPDGRPLPGGRPARDGRPAPARPGPNGALPPGALPLLSGTASVPSPAEAPTELMSSVTDGPTELIDRVDDYDDYYDDDYDDYYDDDYYDDDYEEPRKDKVSLYAKLAGELLLTAGMVVLLFVVYEVWITDLISAGRQADATAALDQQWNDNTVGDGRTEHVSPADGQGIAKLYIPSLGQDYKFTVIEGTTDDDLAIGPGHYTGTQEPGARGNFAVAGHRVGKGAPFNDLDLVQPCDSIIVETRDSWFVYRMLPVDDGSTDWQSNPMCEGKNGEQKVDKLTGPYAKTTGRTIVDPSASQVVDAIPYEPDSAVPVKQRKQLLTLTTCHPKFSNAQRMILHAVLVKSYPKSELGDKVPAQLNETS